MEKSNAIEESGVRQLGLLVDGLPLVGAPEPAYALQAALRSLPDELQHIVGALKALDRKGVAVLDGFFDPVGDLLDGLGIAWRRIAAEDLGMDPVRLVLVGCNHRHSRLDPVDAEAFLSRGGMFVTSDRAATLPGLQPYLPVSGGHAPRRSRISITSPIDDMMTVPVTPAAWLEPGHRPLSHDILDRPGTRLLATDTLSGDPLVVEVTAGAGKILHSVPHWYQASVTSVPTGLESRLLARVPCYSAIGNSYPKLTLGAFLPMRVMLELLLSSVGSALEIPIAQKNQLER